jgi:Uma2 family endonuclease
LTYPPDYYYLFSVHYTSAGIQDYWVFDIGNRRLIVHRDPIVGSYRGVTAYAEGESVTPLAQPDATFPVAAAFPFPAGKVSASEL